ncbi:Hpt domain-containing protein [bacterium]|nr:Hpt domain-containing protein [bacterium]
MLIYNYKKEFLGIDEVDLQALGFKDLTSLQAEVSDFSDLFVKTPGYIHNFKHVHWIDFITCADSTEPPKVIIHAHSINYKCNLKITPIYLSDNPTEKAFIVNLQNLRRLSDSESSSVALDIAHKQAQTPAYTPPTTPFNHFEAAHVEPIKQEFKEIAPEIDEIQPYSSIIEDVYDDLPLEVAIEEDVPVVKVQHEPLKTVEIPKTHPIEAPKTTVETHQKHHHEDEYIFDPNVASKELGLPVDLIEEFIQDFIAQAKEFKDELYTSLHELDISNVKILSHKLKGVAANLRVVDALEALTVVNTATDFSIIRSNLDKFYRIILKLAGETPAITPTLGSVRSEEDDFVVEFKEDDFDVPIEIAIDDSDVPNTIEMPELADDDFKPNQIKEFSPDLLDIDFDTVDADDLSLEVAEINELPDMLDTFDDEEKLELLNIDEDNEIQPVTLLQTQEKQKVTINYKREAIANEIGIDIESFNELFDDFIDESQVKCKQIRAAISNENSDLWKVKAMKLKGMSENMRITELSHELDTIIKSSDSSVALDSINKIDAMMSQISNKEA